MSNKELEKMLESAKKSIAQNESIFVAMRKEGGQEVLRIIDEFRRKGGYTWNSLVLSALAEKMSGESDLEGARRVAEYLTSDGRKKK